MMDRLVGSPRLSTLLFRLLALVLLLVGFGVRLWHIDTQSIWHDEGWSIHAVRDPINTPDDKTPLAYYSLMHVLWRAGAGETPLGLRYGSVLLGVVGVAAALTLGKRWYGSTAGLSAGALTAVSPLLWAYSQEVRAYIAIPLLAVMLLAGAEGLLRPTPPRRRDWLAVLAVELIALYTHNLGVGLVLWVNAAVGMGWLVRRDWRRMGVWAGLQILLLLLYIPWLLTQAPSGTPLNTPPQIGLGLLRDIWYSAFLPVLLQLRQGGENPALDGLVLWLMVSSAALVVWAVRGTGRERLRVWLTLSHIVLVPAFTLVVLLAAHVDFHPRYFITPVPGMMLALAGGTNVIAGSMLRKQRQWAQVAAGVVLTVIVAGISLTSLNTIESNRAYQHDDFAGLAAYYASLPDDTVILMPFGTEPALQGYFAPRLNIRARFVNVPLYSGEDAAVEAINQIIQEGGRRVEFLTWYQLPADERGMYPCLLAAASQSVGESHTFYGLMTQSYILDHTLSLKELDSQPRYDALALNGLAYAAAPAGVCVRSEWSSGNTPSAEPMRVAAGLLNPLEQRVARSDAEITRDDQASLPLWTNGQTGAAYNLLTLPAGAPLLDYSLILTLYSESQPSGFDVRDEQGLMLGKQLKLANAVQASGPPYPEVVSELRLQSDSAGESKTITTGIPLDVTLVLPPGNHTGLIRLAGEGWALEMPAPFMAQPSLMWQRLIVPPGDSGEAVLSVDEQEVARYTVIDPPRLFDAPEVDIPLGAVFPGVGKLMGATLNPPDLAGGGTVEVTLVWQAEATPATSYTVFVQLLGADGSVIAQDDALPVANTRPTTGWVAGEYIVDAHPLNMPTNGGQGRLIVGLYDAGTPGLPRLLTADGADYVEIPMP